MVCIAAELFFAIGQPVDCRASAKIGMLCLVPLMILSRGAAMPLRPCWAGKQAADPVGGLTAGLHFLHSRKIVHFDMVSQAHASSRLQAAMCLLCCLPCIEPWRLASGKLFLLPEMPCCLPELSADQLHVSLQKSANVLLARGYTSKIADVGLAKILHHEFLSTMAAVGTFFWCAPEVSSLLP